MVMGWQHAGWKIPKKRLFICSYFITSVMCQNTESLMDIVLFSSKILMSSWKQAANFNKQLQSMLRSSYRRTMFDCTITNAYWLFFPNYRISFHCILQTISKFFRSCLPHCWDVTALISKLAPLCGIRYSFDQLPCSAAVLYQKHTIGPV